MKHVPKHIGHAAREDPTDWIVAGAILTATGVASEHWLADLFHDAHVLEGRAAA